MNIAKQIFNSTFTIGFLIICLSFSCNNEKKLIESGKIDANNKYITLSSQLMNNVQNNEPTESILETLAKVNPDTLASFLITDNQKKAFWINVYNAHIQIFLSQNPELFENRGKYFSTKRIAIAQEELSFDDIEHGIIRSSKFKLALGLIRNPFAGEFEKKFRTRETDGRVHFALNCGAKSCPLVATYDAKNFDAKVDRVAKSFLNKMSNYDTSTNTLTTTTLFSWFRGDFGGKKGVLQLLKKYDIVPQNSKPAIEYSSYDWTLSLGNYYEE